MSKSILQIIYSCSVQKTGRKNTKYLRNETILKTGHHAKAIAFAKSSLLFKNYNSKKTCQNPFYKSFTVVLCKKPLEKTLNIQEINFQEIFKTEVHNIFLSLLASEDIYIAFIQSETYLYISTMTLFLRL